MSDLLTVKAAAKRVKRSTRQIERWIDGGLPIERVGRTRYIRIEHLLAELRKRNLADPSKAREAAQPDRARAHLLRKYSDTTD